MKKVLVICGPTASGKTSLALDVAHHLGNTSILSADSRQVYQGIDIVSGKDTPKNLPNSIKIFGQGIFTPSQRANLSEYVNYARRIIDQETSLGRQVIIVGGTGLYLKGILETLDDISVPANQDLRTELERLTLQELQNKLITLNPDKFNNLNNSDLNNPRRLIRKIEISLNDQDRSMYPAPKVSYYVVGLKAKKNNFLEKITERVVERINNGAIEEVKSLLSQYPDKKLPIFTTLGVAEISNYLDKSITRDELIKIWSINEHNYAKRQMVWFKKQQGIIWYDESVDKKLLSLDLTKYLTKNDQIS